MSCFKVPPESPSSEDVANALRPYMDAPAWKALAILAKCKEAAIVDAMAKEIQWLTDEQMEQYLPQLCHIVLRNPHISSLAKILTDKSAESIHFALLIFWMLHSIPNDPEDENQLPEETQKYLEQLQGMCEDAAVRSAIDSPLGLMEEQNAEKGLEGGATLVDQARSDRFNLALSFVLTLTTIGKRLIDYPKELRQEVLQRQLEVVNCLNLPGDGVQVPSLTHGAPFIVRVAPSHCVLLNSRDKTPYLVYLEVVDTSDLVAAQQVALTASGAPPTTPFQNAVQQDTAQPSPSTDLRDTSGYGADTEDRDTPPQSPRFPGMVPSPGMLAPHSADPFSGLILAGSRNRRKSRDSAHSVRSRGSDPRSRSVSPGEGRPTPRQREEPVFVVRNIDTGEILKMEDTNDHVELCLHRSLQGKVAATGEDLPPVEDHIFSTDESETEGESSDQREGAGPSTLPYEGVVAAGAGRGSDSEGELAVEGRGWRWWNFGWGGKDLSSRDGGSKDGSTTEGEASAEGDQERPEHEGEHEKSEQEGEQAVARAVGEVEGEWHEEMLFGDGSDMVLTEGELGNGEQEPIEYESPARSPRPQQESPLQPSQNRTTLVVDSPMGVPGIASSLPDGMSPVVGNAEEKGLTWAVPPRTKKEDEEVGPAETSSAMAETTSTMDSPGMASSLPRGEAGAEGTPEKLVMPPSVCDAAADSVKASSPRVPAPVVTVTTCSGDEVDVTLGQSPKEWQTGGASSENNDDKFQAEDSLVGVELADGVFGKRLDATEQAVKEESPFAHLPTWRLVPAIVKSGDSFLQERLALQLISEMAAIFCEAGLPIRLHPYKVLIDSSLSGLIQAVPDAISIHTLKSQCPAGCVTLSSLFARIHKDDPEELSAARRRFANSLAGYSVVCYLMQIKDRHNGNILIDRQGHIIHIDFGFMLSNSPGSNMNFEQAPFKLTSEAVDFLGGRESPQWAYYRRLVVEGFLAVRQQWQRVVQLVEMTLEAHRDLPCFDNPHDDIVKEMVSRFALDTNDEDMADHVIGLIDESLDHWTTWQYDSFQYMSNGILYS